MKTIFEKSQKEQRAYSLPINDKAFAEVSPPEHLLRKDKLLLPEVSELDLTRHFCELASRNMGIDNAFYPLGSCTMKFNPRVNEFCAQIKAFSQTHPLASEEYVQGNLTVIRELIQSLCQLTGMSAGSLLPNAGAQGEFIGIRLISTYHQKKGDIHRKELLIPDNAHGTNSATATMAGFNVISIRTNFQGDLDLDHLKSVISERSAGLMLTNPNTLGLFSSSIIEIAEVVHQSGGLLYYDGANMNPMLNIVRPGNMGFDVLHLNLHKTFSTPHGGGGPGAGAVLCNDKLKEFLPVPRVELKDDFFKVIWNDPQSIGKIASFHGNFAIYLRAYLYIKLLGNAGLRRVAEMSVLNANYLKTKISSLLTIPFPQYCLHEFVVQADKYLDKGVKAFDIAKRLLDYGVYSPTIYFPLIIKECMLIEPTETESKATLDLFVTILKSICKEIEENPEIVKTAPHNTPVKRLDEVKAAKNLKLKALLS